MDANDIQGLLASGYSSLPHSVFFLLKVEDAGAAKKWITRMAGDVTHAAAKPGRVFNLAVSASGLRQLGMPEALRNCFSFAFRDGMTQSHRARALGDFCANGHAHWNWGAPHQERIDIVLLAYFDSVESRAAGEAGIRQELSGLAEVRALPGQLTEYEHFGFRDGISQPAIAGLTRGRRALPRDTVAAGEFVLGHADESGRVAGPATLYVDASDTGHEAAAPFWTNGSYLVLRELKQDVAGFTAYAVQQDPANPDGIKEKIVGRTAEGEPLVRRGQGATNDFLYQEDDPDGVQCPIGSHVRRTNPRDSLAPGEPPLFRSPAGLRATALKRVRRRRLLRRGRAFGEPLKPGAADGGNRGLYFVCLCADLERQFEFVQQTWLNNASFAELSGEPDPLTANTAYGDSFTIPGPEVPKRICGIPQFVTVQGGAYFFLPSLSALRLIGEGRYPA